jgi:hypothetical protein
MIRFGASRVLVTVVIVVLGLVAFFSRGGEDPNGPQADRAPIVTVNPDVTTVTPQPGPVTDTATSRTDPAGVAVKFVTAWLSRRPGEATVPWLNRMRPYAGPVLLNGLSTSAADAVQASRVTGPPRVIDSGQFGAQVIVPVDIGPDVLCGMSAEGGEWKVTSLNPIGQDPS